MHQTESLQEQFSVVSDRLAASSGWPAETQHLAECKPSLWQQQPPHNSELTASWVTVCQITPVLLQENVSFRRCQAGMNKVR